METKLERISQLSKENPNMVFTSIGHLINKEMLKKCHETMQKDFVFNESGTKVLRCPAGYEPKSCGYTGAKSQQFHVSFLRDQCAGMSEPAALQS